MRGPGRDREDIKTTDLYPSGAQYLRGLPSCLLGIVVILLIFIGIIIHI